VREKYAAALLILAFTASISAALFSSPAAAADNLQSTPTVWVENVNTARVGIYEKFEVIVGLNAEYSNPYDPDEINVRALFTSPSGREWEIYGFFDNYQGVSQWKVRFAPNETGEWSYQVKATGSGGTGESGVHTFTAVPSEYHGWIRVSPDNPHYLMHDDGTSFYGVGVTKEGIVTLDMLDDVVAHGANVLFYNNVARNTEWKGFWHGEENMGLIESLESGVGRYDQDKCWRIDRLLEWCKERELYVVFNIWKQFHLSETVWGQDKYKWNPYKTICDAKDFYSDPTAWEYQKKQYRYIIARWGYSQNLAAWHIICEIDGTQGWVDRGPVVAENWVSKVHNYFKSHDPYGHPTTGSMCGNVRAYWKNGYEILDLPNRHVYESQGWPVDYDNPIRSSIKNYAEVVQKLWNDFDKPACIGETGAGLTYVERSDPAYGIVYHNALWTCWANGLAISPIWWEYPNYMNEEMLNYMKHFSLFVSSIDYAHLPLSPAEVSASGCDAYGMKSDNLSFGWIVNQNGVSGMRFEIRGLPDGPYQVEWYDTWVGRTVLTDVVNCTGGLLSTIIPDIGEPDVAYKIFPFDNTPPEMFGLISPENNSILRDNRPTLIWQTSSDEYGIDHYEVWLDGVNVENVPAWTTEYTVAKLSEGSHEWYIVAVDKEGNRRESEVFTFEIPAPAEFAVENLSVSPESVTQGESVTVSVDVANTGGSAGEHTVKLKVDGEVVDSQTVTLDPGQSTTVSFTVSENEVGTHTISIANLTGSFEVVKPEEPGFDWTIPAVVGAVIVAAIIGAVMYRRRSR